MRLIIAFFIIIQLGVTANVAAQKVSLNEINTPLETVFNKIKEQTGYTFVYTDQLFKKVATVSIAIKNGSLDEAIAQVISNQPFNYAIYNKMVVIIDKQAANVDDKNTGINATAGQAYAVTGTITGETGQPLGGATVFITDSKKATSTDTTGKFTLPQLLPGNYELVVTMIGFNPARQGIKIEDRDININLKLQESNILLNEVTISSTPPPKQNKSDLRVFIKNFIGTSANARQCEIVNPEVLRLHFNKGVLEGHANDYVIIENKALGYRIKYLLKEFKYYYREDICYYDGNPYFEELEGNEQQKKQWENNRKEAYLGSSRHFFRAAMNNSTRAEGFFVYKLNDKQGPDNRSPLKPLDIDTMLVTVNDNFKALISKQPYANDGSDLYIYYIRAHGHQDELTWVKQCADTVIIDKNGGQLPGGNELFNTHSQVKERGLSTGVAFNFWARWGFQRVADLTPLDYAVTPPLDSAFLKSTAMRNISRKNPSVKKLRQIFPFDMNSLIGSTNVYGIVNSPQGEHGTDGAPVSPAIVPDSLKNNVPIKKVQK